jgi:hypothetical protein
MPSAQCGMNGAVMPRLAGSGLMGPAMLRRISVWGTVLAGVVTLTLGASAHAQPYSPTFATWSSAGGTSAGGVLGSTGFTVSGFDLELDSWDLSNAAWFAAPGSASTQSLVFNQGNYLLEAGLVTTITFDNAVSDLALYALYWRAQSYSLVAKDALNNDVSYSFLSGSLTPAISDNSFTASGWLSGIIQFSGAVERITFSTALGPGGGGILSLATLGEAAEVSEPGSLALLGLGLAGVGLVRRRRHA